jgi:hypothetical protein
MTLYASRFTLRASRLAARRWLMVLGLCGASVLVYWVGLILPYNLFALMLKPLVDIAKLTRGQPVAQAGFVLTFATLSALYYSTWRMCRGPQPRAVWVVVLGSLLVINLSMLWLYPVGAADLFDNIVRGRITARYGGNPFYLIPREVRHDPFFRYVAWPDATSAYGPGWEMLAAGLSRLAGDTPLANVLAFKVFGLVCYSGCVALIVRILQRHAPERVLQGVCLFACNPLVIYETAGNGHNDIVMVFFMLWGLDWLLQRRFTRAALALTAGALIKFLPVLLLPVALAHGLRALPTWRSRVRWLLGKSAVCAALVVVGYAPFWRGGDILAWGRRETLFTASLPAVIQVHLQETLGLGSSQRLVSREALLLVGMVVLAQTRQAWRHGGWLGPVRAFTFILLFYLLVAALWFQPWYTLWPLALAAILPEGVMGRTAVLLSYAALWKAIIFDFILVRMGSLPPLLWRETWLGPATLGIVWLYSAYALIRNEVTRRLAARQPP